MQGATIFVSAEDGTLPGPEEEHEEVMKYRQQFELHQYYSSIKEFTFETVFLPLTVEEVRAWRSYNRGVELTEEEDKLFSDLKHKLDESINTFTSRGNKAFVRLSTRSPKDAVDKIPERIDPLIRKHLTPFNSSPLDSLDGNTKLVALRRAFFDCMQVTSAAEVFELMMYSSRAVSDIKRALDFVGRAEWELNLIIREFVDMPIEGELRGFVYKGNLNALSQYYADCYFEELDKNKDKIARLVNNFFSSVVSQKIKLESYICDFVVMRDDTVKIVELNPYSRSTGACLFDWVQDKEIIEHGPFEMRINSAPLAYVDSHLVPFLPTLQRVIESMEEKKGRSRSGGGGGGGGDDAAKVKDKMSDVAGSRMFSLAICISVVIAAFALHYTWNR